MNALVVTGSRHGHKWVRPTLGLLHARKPLTHLVLGCARGVDRQALEWALDHNVFFVVFTAEWDRLGRSVAGKERNKAMVRLGAAWGGECVGFPVGPSYGTHHCMDTAVNAGLPVWRVSEVGKIEGWF